MKRYGLLGEKLSHSYSLFIHKSIYKLLQIEASYELIECKEEELKEYIQLLKEGIFHGFNVTIPYKKIILKYLDEIDEVGKKIGSVNTIYLKENKVYGTNTDYFGFKEMISYYKINLKNKNCYILGTGGSSLAIRCAVQDFNGKIHIVSRTPKLGEISYEELENKKIDVLINTTPVGMFPYIDESPVSREIAQKAKKVLDIIFNPSQTKLLKYAHSKMNGLYMLILQAIYAEELWQQKDIQPFTSILLKEVRNELKL